MVRGPIVMVRSPQNSWIAGDNPRRSRPIRLLGTPSSAALARRVESPDVVRVGVRGLREQAHTRVGSPSVGAPRPHWDITKLRGPSKSVYYPSSPPPLTGGTLTTAIHRSQALLDDD